MKEWACARQKVLQRKQRWKWQWKGPQQGLGTRKAQDGTKGCKSKAAELRSVRLFSVEKQCEPYLQIRVNLQWQVWVRDLVCVIILSSAFHRSSFRSKANPSFLKTKAIWWRWRTSLPLNFSNWRLWKSRLVISSHERLVFIKCVISVRQLSSIVWSVVINCVVGVYQSASNTSSVVISSHELFHGSSSIVIKCVISVYLFDSIASSVV